MDRTIERRWTAQRRMLVNSVPEGKLDDSPAGGLGLVAFETLCVKGSLGSSDHAVTHGSPYETHDH
jgi:hypothetical protein